ncbi:unnamed protein product [Hyaloperonospora brassicae]|uniref:Uncharacterized protein n=1 Tax=Hyaloperonospora brassicae TaxID=162125 RepID=A0AAV0UN36_HYABA|nr:unnamed protein product [Hyaloperonospora brassicae]CAI5738380.1 unnamed protein product [Hyaloperonospora brassicae]
MPSLRAITTSLLGLFLLTISSATDAAQRQSDGTPQHVRDDEVTAATPAQTAQLLSALQVYGTKNKWSVCVFTSNAPVKKGNAYAYFMVGCQVDETFAGACPDLYTFPKCGNYTVVVSSPESKKPKVKSVTVVNLM